MIFRLYSAALLIAALSMPALEGHAADLAVRQVQPIYDVSPCSDARMLEKISRRFDHQVRNVPGIPLVGITAFHDIRQHRYLPAHEDSPIARHYCNATVWLTDGHSRKIWYLIEEGQGFAGMGDDVEFCLAGFDRWNVYNAHCRVLQ